MTATAAEQLRRLLHLLPALADGGEHALRDVAAQAGVDEKTLVRDLRSLADRLDDPGGFVEGVQITIDATHAAVHTSHFRRPMRLTTSELRALDLGLSMLRGERPSAEHGAIARARSRLADALAETDDDWTAEVRHADLAASADPEHLAALRRALREHRVVRLTYRKGDAREAAPRDVHPYALVAAHGAWYLVAHCSSADAVRVFRLDRAESVTVLEAAFEPPADFSLDDVVRDGRVFTAAEPETLRVRYGPRIARWIAEREGRAPDPDGSITIEHPLADHAWAVRHVLQYGADAEVLSPHSVRAALAARLEAMRAAVATNVSPA